MEPPTNPQAANATRQRGRRAQIRTACNACVRRKTRCDGARPACAPCCSRNAQRQCQYDTHSNDETRSSALKRDKEALTAQLAALGKGFEYLLELSDEDALRLLRRARQFANPISALSDLPHASSARHQSRLRDHRVAKAIISPLSQTQLEHELAATYPQAFMRLPLVNVRTLNDVLHWSLPMPTEGDIEGSMVFRMRSVTARCDTSSTTEPIRPAVQESLPLKPPAYLHTRLQFLPVTFWTRVPVSSEFAARAISRYLGTNHVFNTCFDQKLFLSDLLAKRERYCSRLLVNAILYVSCVSALGSLGSRKY